ncbi:MAG: ATP-binding protein [Leptospiraceae bacterium]|nr:ATP-binding protein [Leptospiraceae bacterium]
MERTQLIKEIFYCFAKQDSKVRFIDELKSSCYRFEIFHNYEEFQEFIFTNKVFILVVNQNDLKESELQNFLLITNNSYFKGVILSTLELKSFKLRENWQLLPVDSSLSTVTRSLKRNLPFEEKNYRVDNQVDKLLIYSMLTSFSQGAGPGSTISLIGLMKSVAIKEDDYYKIPAEVYDLIQENNSYTLNIIRGMNRMYRLYNEVLEKTNIKVEELYKLIDLRMKDILNKFITKKISTRIELEKFLGTKNLEVDIPKFLIAIEELIMNAFSFTIPETEVLIELKSQDDLLLIRVTNEIHPSNYEGIPKEKEQQVLLPFVKNHPPTEEVMKISRFGFGLGLTAVAWITSLMKGTFRIFNSKPSPVGRKFVHAELFLPLKN